MSATDKNENKTINVIGNKAPGPYSVNLSADTDINITVANIYTTHMGSPNTDDQFSKQALPNPEQDEVPINAKTMKCSSLNDSSEGSISSYDSDVNPHDIQVSMLRNSLLGMCYNIPVYYLYLFIFVSNTLAIHIIFIFIPVP